MKAFVVSTVMTRKTSSSRVSPPTFLPAKKL
jgi:hypothetical protein